MHTLHLTQELALDGIDVHPCAVHVVTYFCGDKLMPSFHLVMFSVATLWAMTKMIGLMSNQVILVIRAPCVFIALQQLLQSPTILPIYCKMQSSLTLDFTNYNAQRT